MVTNKEIGYYKKRKHGNQNKIRPIIMIVSTIICICSCTPQERLHRLLALHPELTTVETIHIQDSIFIPQTKIDTFLKESYLLDTVTITEDKLSVKLLKMHDTIYLNALYKPDTIVIEKKVPVEKIVHEIPQHKSVKENWQISKDWLLIILLLLFVGIFLGYFSKR